MDNGDFVVGKDGKLGRKPMSGRDLGATIGIVQDKRALIKHEPTKISDNSATRLEYLAKAFDRIAQ